MPETKKGKVLRLQAKLGSAVALCPSKKNKSEGELPAAGIEQAYLLTDEKGTRPMRREWMWERIKHPVQGQRKLYRVHCYKIRGTLLGYLTLSTANPHPAPIGKESAQSGAFTIADLFIKFFQ